MSPLVQPFFAAASISEWLSYPILRLGEAEFTVLSVLKFFLWVATIAVANFLLRRSVVRRLLR